MTKKQETKKYKYSIFGHSIENLRKLNVDETPEDFRTGPYIFGGSKEHYVIISDGGCAVSVWTWKGHVMQSDYGKGAFGFAIYRRIAEGEYCEYSMSAAVNDGIFSVVSIAAHQPMSKSLDSEKTSSTRSEMVAIIAALACIPHQAKIDFYCDCTWATDACKNADITSILSESTRKNNNGRMCFGPHNPEKTIDLALDFAWVSMRHKVNFHYIGGGSFNPVDELAKYGEGSRNHYGFGGGFTKTYSRYDAYETCATDDYTVCNYYQLYAKIPIEKTISN